MCSRNRCLIFLVDKLEVEVLTEVCRDKFEIGFGECFSEANSFASRKWSPTCRVSFCAGCCLADGVGRVESFRNEFFWSLPLTSIVVECIQLNRELVSLPEVNVSNPGVLREFEETSADCR